MDPHADGLVGPGEQGDPSGAPAWGGTVLGPSERWPAALRAGAESVLEAPQPAFLAWGPERTLVWNDAAARLLALASPGCTLAGVWPAGHAVRASVERALAGETDRVEDAPLSNIGPERTATLASRPLRDARGAVHGALCTAFDTTERVVLARRLALLRAVAGSSTPLSAHETAGDLARALSAAARDLPFALVYLEDQSGAAATLVAAAGLEAGAPAAPHVLALDGGDPWSVADVLHAGRTHVTRDLAALPGPLPARAGRALAVALGTAPDARRGVLVVGLPPGPAVVPGEQDFVELLARQIGARLATARPNEEGTRESERRLRTLIANLPGMVYRRRGAWDGRIEFLSDAVTEITGHPREDYEAGRRSWIDAVHEDDRARVQSEVRLADEGGDRYTVDYRIVHADGTTRWVYEQGEAIVDDAGQVSTHEGFVLEVTERRLAVDALRDSEERFRTLADHMSQLAWMADPRGWIFWYNRRWFEYTGTTLEAMQGWGWRTVHHPDHIERVVERIQRSWDTGEPWEDTFPLRGADGQYRWFLSRALPIRDAQGRVLRWFGTNTDITEIRDLEQALRDADRRKDEFLATLAHELRNPLAPLHTGLQLLQMGPPPEHQARAHAMMGRQLAQLVDLVDDLLDASRVQSGKITLRTERITLREMVEAALETCRAGIVKRGHRLEVDLPEEELWVPGDRTRLIQVVTNLLQNASKYTEPGGCIRVEGRREERAVVVRVTDTGIGLHPRALPTVWVMFSQVRDSLDRSQGGLGIGLSLVKRLVEMHGGQVWAESPGLGQGSTFGFRLPLEVEAPEDASPARSPDTPPPRRVLVVDDNVDAADSLSMQLALLGHHTRTVHDGAAAVAAARELRPEVVFCDLGMPGLDGFQVAERLQADPETRAAVLVALTGWGSDEDKRKTRAAGFAFHLTKPVDGAQVQAILAALPSPA